MILSFNKNLFVDNILCPASKITDNLSLTVYEENGTQKIKAFVASSNGTVLLLASIPCNCSETGDFAVPDCKTFLRLFSGIDKQEVKLKLNSNSIDYDEPEFSFKYHLLDDCLINKKTLSESKVSQIEYQTTFLLTKQKLNELIKYNSIVPDAEKLYVYSKQDSVYAKLGDEQKANTNEIVTQLSDSYTGTPINSSFPLDIQNMLLFSFGHNEIQVSINHELKLFKFTTPHLAYIVSGLVK